MLVRFPKIGIYADTVNKKTQQILLFQCWVPCGIFAYLCDAGNSIKLNYIVKSNFRSLSFFFEILREGEIFL